MKEDVEIATKSNRYYIKRSTDINRMISTGCDSCYVTINRFINHIASFSYYVIVIIKFNYKIILEFKTSTL